MRFKPRKIVKSIFIILGSATIFACFNSFIVINDTLWKEEEVAAAVTLKHGHSIDHVDSPNGVKVIKRGLKQNESEKKLIEDERPDDKLIFRGKSENTAPQNITKSKNRTELKDVFISVKTTTKYHESRLTLLLDTWWNLAKNETYFFTDSDDPKFQQKTNGHMINTNCSNTHNRKDLCCKMALEFDFFIESQKQWFCHVDDDTYINVPRLVQMLQEYDPNQSWYLGKPSLSHPFESRDPDRPGQRMTFWFATGGAGVCLSRALALNIMPFTSGGKFKGACDKIRLPDDCTLGYIITRIAKEKLTVISNLHSHLEGLWLVNKHNLHEQITLSYGYRTPKKNNVPNLQGGLSENEDPSRFHSIHCFLNPDADMCAGLTF